MKMANPIRCFEWNLCEQLAMVTILQLKRVFSDVVVIFQLRNVEKGSKIHQTSHLKFEKQLNSKIAAALHQLSLHSKISSNKVSKYFLNIKSNKAHVKTTLM